MEPSTDTKSFLVFVLTLLFVFIQVVAFMVKPQIRACLHELLGRCLEVFGVLDPEIVPRYRVRDSDLGFWALGIRKAFKA